LLFLQKTTNLRYYFMIDEGLALSASAVPLILVAFLGLLFGLLSWSVLRPQHQGKSDDTLSGSDLLLVGLLLLASLAMAVFLVFFLLDLPN
jgi:hypothetical protein